jgi:hypothetical protein
LKEPTSLNGGEGLVAGSTGDFGGIEGEGGGGEVVVEEGESEQNQCDVVDGDLKLRSPP